MTTSQSIRELLTLLESVENSSATDKPLSKEEHQAIQGLEQALDSVSLEENWKKIAGAAAISLAALMSNLAHADNPGGLIDVSNPANMASSCQAILYDTLNSGLLSPATANKVEQARSMFAAMATSEMKKDPRIGNQTIATFQRTDAKAKNLLSSGNSQVLFNAASVCVSALK